MAEFSLLKVIDFTHLKGGRLLFKDLSFDVHAGKMIVLMGPNGSGKTTLLRCLAGIPDVLPGISRAPDVNISYVGHLNALKMHLTVQQNLLHQTNVTEEILHHTLKESGLLYLKDREIRTLSVGQQRQVALSRLPLSNAKLWLIDEPITHLDERATNQFWATVEVHLTTGGSVVLSSHTLVSGSHAEVVRLHG